MTKKKAPGPDAESLIRSTLEGHRVKAEADRLRTENKALLGQVSLAREMSGVVEALRASARQPKPVKATKRELLHKRVATPVFLVSDLHVEETVKPETVGGLNTYNLEIADRRMERLSDGMVWVIEHNRKSFEIRECVVWLGGDLLSGYIHDELKEGNSLSPVQTLLWLQERLTRMFEKLLAVPGIERIVVPCNVGNHGRTTPKIQIATATANSYEWLLYHQLRRSFAKEPRLQFDITDGDFLRMQVHETRLGFHHGHLVKFNGGVGGVTIPLNKAISRWDTYGTCDLWHSGHFHQIWYSPRVIVNGSLIGTGPFGMAVGGFEAPAQASYLVDAKRGPCMYTSIWVEDSDHASQRLIGRRK